VIPKITIVSVRIGILVFPLQITENKRGDTKTIVKIIPQSPDEEICTVIGNANVNITKEALLLYMKTHFAFALEGWISSLSTLLLSIYSF
jgi:hypothetical protein